MASRKKLWGSGIAAAWLVLDGVALGMGWSGLLPADAPLYLLIGAAVGGPAALIIGLLLGIAKPRPAGALLWLGASALALSIAIASGTHAGRYFLGLALFVVPQALAGSLYLMSAPKPPRRTASR